METCRNCSRDYYKKSDKTGCCSVDCISQLRFRNFVELWKNGEINGGGKSVSQYVRRYLFEKYQSKCSVCEWSKVNPFTGRIPLEIDHINGDKKDHSERNLRLLCPNCHSLTATYGTLNKKLGSEARKILHDDMYNEHLKK
jgi:5-methylcytosine-specific restriction endonuclease McrA